MKTTSGYLHQRAKDSKGNGTGNYYLMYTIHGKKKLISLGTANKVKAEAKRDEILQPALMANNIEKVTRHIAEARELMSDSKIELDDIWKHYLKSTTRPQSSPGTLGNYERFLKAFCKWLKKEHPGIERINQVTSKEAEAYMLHLWTNEEHEITANTFNYHLQGLNLVFKIIFDSQETPFSKIQRKKGTQINRKDFTKEQLNQLFEAIDKKECDIGNKKEMKLLCYVGAYTGLRMFDAIHLKWAQVDFPKKMISALPIKTKGIQRNVHIPLHPELKAHLDRAESLGNGGYIMPIMVEVYHRNPDAIMKDFTEVLDKAKLTEVVTAERGRDRRAYGYHSFRHTFASFAANAGIPISTLLAILGDNPRTLEKYYIKASSESKTKAVMSLPSLTAGNDTGEVIDIKPVDELAEIQKRVSDALELIRTATKKDISEAFTAQLVKILQPA